MSTVHFLPLRGTKTLCGIAAERVACSADINNVVCVMCQDAHGDLTRAAWEEARRHERLGLGAARG